MKDRRLVGNFEVTTSLSVSDDMDFSKFVWTYLKSSFFCTEAWTDFLRKCIQSKIANSVKETKETTLVIHSFLDNENLFESERSLKFRLKGVRAIRWNPLQSEIALSVGFVKLTPAKNPGYTVEDVKVSEHIMLLQFQMKPISIKETSSNYLVDFQEFILGSPSDD